MYNNTIPPFSAPKRSAGMPRMSRRLQPPEKSQGRSLCWREVLPKTVSSLCMGSRAAIAFPISTKFGPPFTCLCRFFSPSHLPKPLLAECMNGLAGRKAETPRFMSSLGAWEHKTRIQHIAWKQSIDERLHVVIKTTRIENYVHCRAVSAARSPARHFETLQTNQLFIPDPPSGRSSKTISSPSPVVLPDPDQTEPNSKQQQQTRAQRTPARARRWRAWWRLGDRPQTRYGSVYGEGGVAAFPKRLKDTDGSGVSDTPGGF
ncbi:hypothetical protein BU26DRAFT_347735 [Trematosphaeria pertusa]|uniref:Uncharacterized protein n=1 Tax=Trematosphaeria pertusa TaxID=390896 RepID=A0A6A6IAK3_9PLEO|nr:uncharacterized protein BU26DRAFT_347735 [Trematosphaeria pertusa]KAF2247411.1 hypothetical protein BU26DRAFT_347735 [Trematosphaeria pertusa]